ncbi:hypothetical protein [Symmachiella dynata]|uniref:hypothetical protein n=1 Tax=Symmachiella dynata TaxID=2527995 RepID=UPI0030EB4648
MPHFPIPEPEKWHSKETAKLVKDATKSVADFRENEKIRAEHKATVAGMDPLQVAQYRPAGTSELPVMSAAEMQVLEHECWKKIFDAWKAIMGDGSGHLAKLRQRATEIENDVAERLVSIGYQPMCKRGIPQRGEVIPDFLNRHPEVLAARAASQGLQGEWNQHLRTCHSELERSQRAVDRLRQSVAGTV